MVSGESPKLQILERGRLCFETPIDRPIVLGRQRSGETIPYSRIDLENESRIIIAARSKTSVSRNQLSIEPLENDGGLRLFNPSSNRIVTVGPGRELFPDKSCLVDGCLSVSVDSIEVLLSCGPERGTLVSMQSPADLLGVDDPDATFAPLMATLGSSFDSNQSQMLMMWLKSIARLFYSAGSDPEFLRKAVHAIHQMAGFDHVEVLSYREEDGDVADADSTFSRWRRVLGHPASEMPSSTISEKQSSLEEVTDAALVKLLGRVAEFGQTVVFHPDQEGKTESLPQGSGVIAPVLNRRRDVCGAILAIHFSKHADDPTISSIDLLEASLVELIASGMDEVSI